MTSHRRVALYARVSTDQQTTENQLRELREAASRNGWEITKEYIDRGISGAKGRDKRPGFDTLLKDASRKQFDLVMSWSVDRLGRSLQDLIGFLSEIHAKGIDLYLHQQGIDTTTPAGKALFQMMGVFAEFERSMIQERVKSGIARAKAEGTKSGQPHGRPSIIDNLLVAKVKSRRNDGIGLLSIARELGVGTGTVQKIVKSLAAPSC